MAPKQDRTYAKIAELEARGLATQAKASVTVRTVAARIQTKASGVIVPVFRSIEEVRASTGVHLLSKVDLPLHMIPLPVCPGHKRGVQTDNHSVSARGPPAGDSSSNAAVSTLGAHAHDVAFSYTTTANAQASAAPAIAGLMKSNLPETAAPSAAAASAAVAALRSCPPLRLLGLPSPELADVTAIDQEQADRRPALKPMASVPACTGEPTLVDPTDVTPAAPGTHPDAAHVPCDPNMQACTLVQRNSHSTVQQGSTFENVSSASDVRCAGSKQQSSAIPPRTPQPSAVSAGLPQAPSKRVYMAEPKRSAISNVHVAGASQQPQRREPSSGATDVQLQNGQTVDKSSLGPGAACAASGYQVPQDGGPNAASHAANAPYPFVGHQTIDSAFGVYDQQQRLHQLQLGRFQQQQQQQQQVHQQQQAQHHLHQLQQLQQQLQQQHMQQLQQLSQLFQLQTQQHHQQQQVQVQQQRRQGGALLKRSHPDPGPPAACAHRPADPSRPPQRPRPCAAFGADLKSVETALTRALTSVFRKEPKLFRDIYSFDLDWWLDARGRPLGDAGDDLLVALLFHNFAAVVVRVDRGAAPACAGRPQLLNPTVSALLNEKVYGNALLLKIFKRDGYEDGVIGTADGSGAALQVFCLSAPQVHAVVLESDNVAWQMDWCKNLMPSLAESLSSDHREAWLSRLPLTPLDEQGNPDLRKALALVKDYFKVIIPMPRARTSGCGPDQDPDTTASSTSSAVAGQGGGQQPSGSGAAVASESRRVTAEAIRDEDIAGLIPTEVAPLLRALRCASPWCAPVRWQKAGSLNAGGHSSCPFGHFWRSLDLGEGSTTQRPVFDAARHWPSKPLEPELCPSLIDRLSQIGWAVVLPGTEAAAGTHGSAFPQELYRRSPSHSLGNGACAAGLPKAPSADGIFAPGASADSEEDEDEVEEGYTPNPAAGKRQLRPEDLTFYLSFCREGSRCRRCHSYYELNLAAALQRLTGVTRVQRTDTAAPGQALGRVPRLGFAVLANLHDIELHEQETHQGGPGKMRSSSRVDASAARVPESASATPGIADILTNLGSSFNWADEPELAEPAPKVVTVAVRTSKPALQPPLSQAYGDAPVMSHLLRPQRLPPPLPMHGLPSAAAAPPLPLRVPGEGEGSDWSSRAPICCHEPSSGGSDSNSLPGAAERSLWRDLRPLPQLPETLDLEPLEARPDRTAVAASLVAKSRNGVYVPPHLRNPMDEGAEADEQRGGLKVSELQAAEAQSATAPVVQSTSSMEAHGLQPVVSEPQASLPSPSPSLVALAMESQAKEAVSTEPHTQMLQASVSEGQPPGEDFNAAAFSASPVKSPVSATPLASLTLSTEAPQPPNQGMEGHQHFSIFPLQAQPQALAPPGFYQANPQVQEQSLPVPVAVPVPVPLPAVRHASAQPQGLYDRQHVAAAAPLLPQNWPWLSNPGQPAPTGDRPSIEMDATLGDCMSLSGLSLGATPLAPPPSSAQQASLLNQGHLLAVGMYGTTAATDGRPTVGGMLPLLPAALCPPLHIPARLGLQVHAPPFSLAHGPAEQGGAAQVPPTLFAAPPPMPSSFTQHSSPQPATWLLQHQHPYVPSSLVASPFGGGPFGGGPPPYGTVPAGFQQPAFQSQHQPAFLPGWPPPLQPYAPLQALGNGLRY